ncbi:hypothetical protein VB715_02740 [Crocosphaera sp. UHCC 0190]|uniref:hypothetical protein n=1 Tax=Crocosphaera sp. UHCC 0190 TaxID=3110246 RepID=UPI002B1F3723|nr:hypothetical protein [Crocosphaera sp. UHCC 0190]MEA5508673.1 hypothetical protein [Crocosphaera sp. UHCC 0190]
MNDVEHDPFQEQKLQKLQQIICLIPVVGWIPAIWTVSRHQGSRQELSASRASIRLTLVWAIAYSLLWFASLQASETLTLRLLYFNGLLTSGYVLVSLGFMFRVWQRKN